MMPIDTRRDRHRMPVAAVICVLGVIVSLLAVAPTLARADDVGGVAPQPRVQVAPDQLDLGSTPLDETLTASVRVANGAVITPGDPDGPGDPGDPEGSDGPFELEADPQSAADEETHPGRSSDVTTAPALRSVRGAVLVPLPGSLRIEHVQVRPDGGPFGLRGRACAGVLLPPRLPDAEPESCVIEVSFTPTSPGRRSGELVITSNDARSPIVVPLAGDGIGTPSLELAPDPVLFGEVPVDTQAVRDLRVSNTGSGPLRITSVAVDAQATTYRAEPACAVVKAGGTCTLHVTFTPAEATSLDGTLVIVSNDPETPRHRVTLSGTGVERPDLAVAPDTLDLGTVELGSAGSDSVTLTNRGGGVVEITSIEVRPGGPFRVEPRGCTVDTQLPGGASCVVDVAFTPTSAGDATATLVVGWDGTDVPVEVALTGAGEERPRIGITPDPVDLVDVDVGTRGEREVTVSNGGGGTLKIVAIRIEPDGPFGVEHSCQRGLRPQEACTATVAFAPSAPGDVDADLVVVAEGSAGSRRATVLGSGNARSATEPPTEPPTTEEPLPSEPATARPPSGAPTAAPAPPASPSGAAPPSDAPAPPAPPGPPAPQQPDPASRGHPALVVHDTVLDFGFLMPGRAAVRVAIATSVGGAPVTVGQVRLDDGGAFAIRDDGCSGRTLAHDASCAVSVRFAGADAGDHRSLLVVPSDAGDPIDVTLRGVLTGPAPAPSVEVPDLVGLTIGDAEDVVRRSRLSLLPVVDEVDAFAVVAEQTPAPGERTAVGTPIDVVLAAATSDTSTVPEAAAAVLVGVALLGALYVNTDVRRPRWVHHRVRIQPDSGSPARVALRDAGRPQHSVAIQPRDDRGRQIVREGRTS
jgi:hypothetical protein